MPSTRSSAPQEITLEYLKSNYPGSRRWWENWSSEDPWPCTFCEKEIRTNKLHDRHRHMKTHLSRLPFHCDSPGCPYETVQPSNLASHMKTHMKKACDIPLPDGGRCGFTYKDKAMFSRHKKRIHEWPQECAAISGTSGPSGSTRSRVQQKMKEARSRKTLTKARTTTRKDAADVAHPDDIQVPDFKLDGSWREHVSFHDHLRQMYNVPPLTEGVSQETDLIGPKKTSYYEVYSYCGGQLVEPCTLGFWPKVEYQFKYDWSVPASTVHSALSSDVDWES
ncbi:hypothetical protein NM688_g7112 [Phlebia brevispora]|uniref:Uncharacterized protein n=1 Tax=Phlebia brevispora TaxID=194682 RepID=A0ACC1S971_9APHY|nr:hypothetical protein NM688_g7112 [Phlebia brevispora]